MKKIFLLVLFILFITVISFSQSIKYSRVQIQIERNQLKDVAALGIPMEGYFVKDGFVCELSANELFLLSKNALQYSVLIDDVSAYYVKQNEKFKTNPELLKNKSNACYPSPYNTPAGFSLGSMGGFYTYNELLAKLDSLHAYYPQLITPKQVIDTINTIEGRPVYWVRISNYPNILQNKPRVLYTALTHAREPLSMQQMVFYMCYLLENYNQNQDVTNIINNFELYFIPCVNPDGYIYNEITDPNGGGLWRKNRKNSGNGDFGIDLNRNFGYMWGLDNLGSSPDASNDTYRGTSAFSEPETRLIKSFCQSYNFKIAINYHTYSNFLLYPFGYAQQAPTIDSVTYKKYAEILTTDNKYAYGPPYDLLGYLSNGDSNDWMYGDVVSKPKIISFTAEVGSPVFGFWPPMNQIEAICKENMYQNIYLAYLSGKFAKLTDLSQKIVTSHHGFFKYDIQNVGLESHANFTVSIVPLSNNFQSIGPAISYNNFIHLQSQTDSIAYNLNLSINTADTVKFLFVVDNGLFSKTDTIVKIFGNETIVFNDNCNNLNNWTTNEWGNCSNVFFSAPSSISDSPFGNYQTSSYSSITLQTNVNLSDALYAELNFYTKFDIAAGYDYVQLLISNDNGASWIPLCGKYSIVSSNSLITDEPAYEGIQHNWVLEEISLKDYLGQNVIFKFELVSDWWPWTKPDGFYFDDFIIKIVDSTFVSASSKFLTNDLNIDIFPNPNSSYINISHNIVSNSPIYIRIYNSTGQTVYTRESTEKTQKIDISQWPDGIYLIKADISDKACSLKKFLKN